MKGFKLLILLALLYVAPIQSYPVDQDGNILVPYKCDMKGNYAKFVVMYKNIFTLEQMLEVANGVYKERYDIIEHPTYVDMQRLTHSMYRWPNDYQDVNPDDVKTAFVVQCMVEGF